MLLRAPLLALLFVVLVAPSRADSESDMTQALVLYHSARYSQAQAIFKKLAADNPNDVDLNFYLGRLALWFDDDAKALKYLNKAVAGAPDDARIQNALGDAYGLSAQHASLFSKFGWAKKCLAAYLRAEKLDPTNVAYHMSLLTYYQLAPSFAGGGMQKAYAESDQIKKLDPITGRIALANLYVTEKKYDQAFALFESVLGKAPDDFIALYQIGRCSVLSGQRLDRGEVALRRCLTLPQPGGEGLPNYVNVHFRLGNILEKRGDSVGARAQYKASLDDNPDFRPAKDALRN